MSTTAQQADFYILSRQDDDSRYFTVCRLVEKAFQQGNRVHVHTQSAEQAELLDELLWSFRADSFVPHALLGSEDAPSAPVTLGHSTWDGQADLLINLAQDVPDFFSRVQRVAEVASQKPDILSAARDHFRFYREHGYNTTTHNLK